MHSDGIVSRLIRSWDRLLLHFVAWLAAFAGIVSAIASVGIAHAAIVDGFWTGWIHEVVFLIALLLAAAATWFGVRRTLAAAENRSDSRHGFPIASRLWRVVLGFLSGGYAAVALVVIAMTGTTIVSGDTMGCMGVWAAIKFALIVGTYTSSTVAVFAIIVFGLPFYFLSRRYGFAAVPCYAIFGLGLSMLALAIPAILRLVESGRFRVNVGLEDAAIVAAALAAGPLATTVFWLIARPDRMQRPVQTN